MDDEMSADDFGRLMHRARTLSGRLTPVLEAFLGEDECDLLLLAIRAGQRVDDLAAKWAPGVGGLPEVAAGQRIGVPTIAITDEDSLSVALMHRGEVYARLPDGSACHLAADEALS